MQHFASYLKARYSRKGLSKLVEEQDLWPPIRTTVYNNLVLIYQKVIQTYEDSFTLAQNCKTGSIENIIEQTESIKLQNIEQIFQPLNNSLGTSKAKQYPKSILVEGYPGIGKTTLAKEISLQWASEKLLVSHKLVLLLLLRDHAVQCISTVYDLFKYFASTSEDAYKTLGHFHSVHGQGLVIIIDGFDELNADLRQSSFFRKLVEGDELPDALVVVTSRPSASHCLHEHVHRRIVILGFEQTSKDQFILDALQEYPTKLLQLQKHLNRNPYMDSICYIPLNMSIMVYLCITGYLPPTATKMYDSFILHTICRHLKRVGTVLENEVFTDISSFPPPIPSALKDIEKLAYENLLDDKIVFTLDDLPDICKNDPTCFGLLQCTEGYSALQAGAPSLTFNFLHLGIQEYFAAKYVASLHESEVLALLKETFLGISVSNPDIGNASVRLSNMWILFFGITGGHSAAVKDYLSADFDLASPDSTQSDSSDEYSTAPSSYYSSQGSSFDESEYHSLSSTECEVGVEECIPENNRLSLSALKKEGITEEAMEPEVSNLTINPPQSSSKHEPPDLVIVKDILQNSVDVLYLFQCFQEAQNEQLCRFLSQTFDQRTIDLSNQRLLPHQILSLGFFLSHVDNGEWNVLNMHKCHIGDHGVNLLHRYLCREKKKLLIKRINLNYNDLTATSSSIIRDFIVYLQPQCLLLDSNKIGDIGVKEISTIVISSPVKELWLGNNGITSKGASAIADMMSALRVLENSYNTIADNGAELLALGIRTSESIKKLNIRDNNIGCIGGKALACALSMNKSLETLWLNNNNVGNAGALAMAEAIPKIEAMKDLSLTGDNTIDEEHVIRIVKSFYFNISITKFHLPFPLSEQGTNVLKQEVENINEIRASFNKLTVF